MLTLFCEPRYYSDPQTFGKKASNFIEGYFDRRKQATTLKIISYATLIFPLIMLVAKGIVRCTMPKPRNRAREIRERIERLRPKRPRCRPWTPPSVPSSNPSLSAGAQLINSLEIPLTNRHIQDMEALEEIDATSKLPEEILNPLVQAYPFLNEHGIGLIEAGQKVEQYVNEKGSGASFEDFVRWFKLDREIDARLLTPEP